MHVEFRVSEVSNICAFGASNYHSVRDLVMRNARAQSNSSQSNMPRNKNAKKASTQGVNVSPFPSLPSSKEREGNYSPVKSKLTFEYEQSFSPRLRAQFILERIVNLETIELVAKAERMEPRNGPKTTLGDSEVSITRYRVFPKEAILASLPASAADCVVKIRLIQLPPKLEITPTSRDLFRKTDDSHNNESFSGDPLCIGVAKITLRELIMIRSGVRMVLQPKQSTVRVVEGLTQNAEVRNKILGKDVGGTASLTLQVLSYSFSNVSHSALLLYHEPQPKSHLSDGVETISTRLAENQTSRNVSSEFSPLRIKTGERELPSQDELYSNVEEPQSVYSSPSLCGRQAEADKLHLNTPAIRFVLIPYISLAILFLLLHDAILWRKPIVTFNIVALLVFAMSVNMLGGAVVLIFFAYLVVFIKTLSKLLHIPIVDLNSGSLVSESFTRETTRNVLYSRRYTFLNALVRAKLFFCQGLQEDSFYELALAFHIVRNHKSSILIKGILLSLGISFLPTELFCFMLIFSIFVLYPISFRFPTIRSPTKKRCQTALRFRNILNAYRVNQPMHISRIVKVVVVLQKPTNNFGPLHTNTHTCHALRPALYNTGESETKSQIQHLSDIRRQPIDSFVIDHMNVEAVERQQLINVMRLSFALVVITDNDPSSDKILLRLLTHFKSTQLLKDKPTDERLSNAEALELGAIGTDVHRSSTIITEDAFDTFFSQTLNLLNFIKKNASLQTYVSPSCSLHTGNLIPLELLAHPLWLVEEGKDDGITATIKAISKCDSIKVGKMAPCPGIDNDARSMALLAGYLMQGFGLSVYSQGENSACAIIIPLKPISNGFQVAPKPNSCSPHLLQALEEIWLGGKYFEVQKGIPIGIDLVLKIIYTYKDRRN